MKDEAEILWKLYQEHCTWERHHEQQRASVTNFFIAVAAGILGVISLDQGLTENDLPLTVFLTAQGLFGALFAAKHYEVFSMHQSRAGQYRDALDSLFPDAQILYRRNRADEKTAARFPRLHRLRLNKFWVGLQLLIALFGVVLTGMILLRLFG